MGPPVRDATPEDAAACADIYAPYVLDTAITFEEQPPGTAEMARRIAAASSRYAWLVLTDDEPAGPPDDRRGDVLDDGRVVGYAYGGPFHERPAYRWSCQVSVYLEPGRRRTGGGRALYEALLTRLADRGFRTAVAGMTLPNPASEGLHRALGFEPVGIYRRIGFKLGRWHDVAWVQRALAEDDGAPTEPR